MTRAFNFSAGPCTLPLEMIEEAAAELADYRGTGMSIIEMSHRGPEYEQVHSEAMELARKLTGAPDGFEVLFIQGGATLQFSMVPINLLGSGQSAGYVRSGAWGNRALDDASAHGDAYVAWDGEPIGYNRMPRVAELDLRQETRYLHITANETIDGIRYPEWPMVDVPLVVDASSEFLSRPIPWDRVDLVYGGVQKNLGPAGMAVVFVRESVLDQAQPAGSYLHYSVHSHGRSLFNTPPVFTVWMTGKVLRWMDGRGGVPAMQAAAERRSSLIYDLIEESDGFYRSPVRRDWRSVMNVVFALPSPELEAAFLEEAQARRLIGLKGHRSVGGCRASIYNAMPDEGVETLVSYMREFQRRQA